MRADDRAVSGWCKPRDDCCRPPPDMYCSTRPKQLSAHKLSNCRAVYNHCTIEDALMETDVQ